MRSAKVSVVMNCLNGEKYLRQAFDSVFGQTYQDWEIIFWDNVSTDKSAEIAKSYGDRVRYFRSDQTHALGKARNLAIQESAGEYLGFLDCDDIWLPEKLERQVPLFEKNSRVGLVSCNTFSFTDDGQQRLFFTWRKPPCGRVFREMLQGAVVGQMPGMMIRKAALEQLDEWFDERFNMIEEADLFLRIAYSWEVDYVDEPLAKWRVHGGSWTWTRGDLLPLEMELMIEKLCRLYDGFEIRFKGELAKLQARAQYYHALLDWQRGRRGEVRRRLLPYLLTDKRLWFPFVCSVLPYSLYFGLYMRLRYRARLG